MAKEKQPQGLPPETTGAPAQNEAPPPPFGTEEMADPGGPVPRVLKQTERAPRGLTRFKIRCNNYSPKPIKYILAKDEDQARGCYTSAVGIDNEIARLTKNAGEKGVKPEPADLVVTQLPD